MLTCDFHIDVPWIQTKYWAFDLRFGYAQSLVTLPRMKKGLLDSMFCALYLPDSMQDRDGYEKSSNVIDMQIRRLVSQMDAVIVDTMADAEDAHIKGLVPIFLGLEGGKLLGPPAGALGRLSTLRNQGVRYLTLTHNFNNDWADSATDNPKHKGLTRFGVEVVKECEKLGIYVDVSHASDATAAEAIGVSEKPVLATHSGVKKFIQHPRNLSDTLILAIAETGGVVGVPFARKFIGDESSSVVRHIDHICSLLGDSTHVGIGSDIDGAAMVNGVYDVSDWKLVVQEKLDRLGYSDEAIANVAGGNILRLMS